MLPSITVIQATTIAVTVRGNTPRWDRGTQTFKMDKWSDRRLKIRTNDQLLEVRTAISHGWDTGTQSLTTVSSPQWTHLLQRYRPEWTASSSACPPWSCWSTSESTRTTMSNRWGRSPVSKAPHKAQDQDLGRMSTGSRPPPLLDQHTTNKHLEVAVFSCWMVGQWSNLKLQLFFTFSNSGFFTLCYIDHFCSATYPQIQAQKLVTLDSPLLLTHLTCANLVPGPQVFSSRGTHGSSLTSCQL